MHLVLLPGAGGESAWFWRRVVPHLQAAGHTATPVDLPGSDAGAGLAEYADLVMDAIGPATDVLLVAQSMGGFTAPLVAARMLRDGRPPVGIVLLNAMVPVPGETPGEWWEAVGHGEAMGAAAQAGGWSPEFDLDTYFLHDLGPDVLEGSRGGDEADAAFSSPCAIDAWPAVPTRAVIGADDRFFPLPFQQRLIRDRLGIEPSVVPGGHLAALSHPAEVAAAILAG